MSIESILTNEQISEFIAQYPDWSSAEGALKAEFKVADFTTAMEVVRQVAAKAEAMDHHPTWCNTYNRLSFSLSTHEAGDQITPKDTALASEISQIMAAL